MQTNIYKIITVALLITTVSCNEDVPVSGVKAADSQRVTSTEPTVSRYVLWQNRKINPLFHSHYFFYIFAAPKKGALTNIKINKLTNESQN